MSGEWIVCEYTEWQYNQITNTFRTQAAIELLENLKDTSDLSDYHICRIQEVIELLCPHGLGSVRVLSLDEMNNNMNIEKIYVLAWQPPQY
jgi:ribonuclease HIII